MSCNLGTIIGGPALVRFKGATFFSKGDITLSNDLETFGIDVDAFGGQVEEREANAPLTVSFIPAGEWENLAVLWPYGDPVIGGSIVPVTTISDIDADADTLTAVNHRLRDGAPIRFATFGTMPTGLVEGTLYYAHVIDDDTISIHTSASDATGDTSRVAITDNASGEFTVIEQEPLVIHTLTGRKLTFFVAAVTQMPDFIGSATQTAIGAVTFEAFRKNGVAASDPAARYAIEDEPLDLSEEGFDPADIVTQPYTGAWGNDAPWDEFSTKTGFLCTFPMTLTPIEDDACGVIGRRLTSVSAEVRAQPTNANETALLAALKLQGTGAGRGRRISGNDLIITGTGVYVRVYGAALRSAPQIFSSQQDRAGELVWASSRTFTNGAPGPVFYVGTEAPSS